MVKRWLQSAISSLVAVPCLPVTGTFVIHVLSMHPMPPLNARPRVPLVASTTVLCPVLSCPVLCVRAVRPQAACFPPTSRRSQLATSLPCLACTRKHHAICLPPPTTLIACCPALSCRRSHCCCSRLPASDRTAACAQQLHPPARQIIPATSYQHTGAQQHHAENCAIAQRTRGSTTLVRPPSLSSYGCSGIFPRRRRRSGSRRPLCPHLLLAQAVRWPLVVRLVATMAAQHAEQRRDAQAIRGAQSQAW